MGKTKIEWTRGDDGAMGYTWNPVRGCSRVSEGCRFCYAERMAARFTKPGQAYHGLAVMQDTGPKWTGKVRLVEEHLEDPLRWRRPRRIFVNSMSDLFHESLSRTDISRVFGVMGQAQHHTFQVLTKRAEGMRKWFETSTGRIHGGIDIPDYPYPNVWLGVSVENQEAADERIPELLRTPAAVRFLSVEPQIGPVELESYLGALPEDEDGAPLPGRIDWVIVGGESGPGARPFDVQWARTIVEQCKAAGVACFVKQLGAEPGFKLEDEERRGNTMPSFHHGAGGLFIKKLRDRKGGDMSEWPPEIRVRQFPEAR